MSEQLKNLVTKFDELYEYVDKIKVKYLSKGNCEVIEDMNNIKINMMIFETDLKQVIYDFDNN